jgi:leucyl-tRNA synthetase
VGKLTTDEHRAEVEAYVAATSRRSERDRITDVTDRTGVFTGAFARNPVNGEEIPVWTADYVLATYGSGAVMAVPGHDQRDWEFAQRFGLPIREVVTGGDLAEEAHEGDGTMVNSSFLGGLSVPEAKKRIVEWLSEEGFGRPKIQYRLRDWLFSRQRYWGEPFPVVFAEDGRLVPVPEADLPVTLPEVSSYEPTGTGESPLAAIPDWVETTDPETGEPARRETNTMPQWAGSCWYYLRFADPHNGKAFVGTDAERYWLPVDIYIGGAEHAVLHLLYARFWHKVLFDLGLVHTREPFRKLVNQGMIICPSYRESEQSPYLPMDAVEIRDGTPIVTATGQPAYSVLEKMSKSKKNVLNPDPLVDEYGADALRLYILFMGPPDADKIWSHSGIEGVRRFLNRAWRLLVGDERHEPAPRTSAAPEGPALHLLHKTIAGVQADMESLAFNTAISKLMIMLNEMVALTSGPDAQPLPQSLADAFCVVLSPLAPHLAEEVWARMGHEGLVSTAAWPDYDPELAKADEVEIAVQVNGKVRDRLVIPADLPSDEVLAKAKALPKVQKHLEGTTIRKEMVVPGRLVVIIAN